MLKRSYKLIFLVFLLAGCSHHIHKQSTQPMQIMGSVTKQCRTQAPFTQIDVEGLINVQLHTGYKKPEVILTGDPRDLAQVKTFINNSTLFVSLGKGFPHFGPVTADIKGLRLTKLRYVGAGIVRGTRLQANYLDAYLQNEGTTELGGTIGLHTLKIVGNGLTKISGISSRNLRIFMTGNPKVQLTGFANLSKLCIDGDGWLSLYWIKSDGLIIRERRGAKVQIAGVVNRLDVELWGTSQFKGRYLRAQRSFVKTHDRSMAKISAVNHQSNLATDASDIYYYNIPTTRADFMAFSGSVLDMREWSRFDMEDFTVYNKQFP